MMDNNIDRESFRNRLLEILGSHPEGLTIEDLSKITDAHRQTVTKYLFWLEGSEKIHMRKIGAITLCYLKKDWERLRK